MAFRCPTCNTDCKDEEVYDHFHFTDGRTEAQKLRPETRVNVLGNPGTVKRVVEMANHSVQISVLTDDNQLLILLVRPTTMIRTD
jgi:hypothetical protein